MKKAILFLSIILTGAALHSYGQAGVLDPGFGTNGISVQVIDSSDLEMSALQQNEKLIVAGDIYKNGLANMGLARFDTNGSIDSTFGINGRTNFLVGTSQNNITGIVVQPDDKIVFGGYCYINSVPFGVLGRCNADGTLDSSFANNGIALMDINKVMAVALRADGKILLATYAGSPQTTVLMRFKTNGTIDSTFGTNGSVIDASNGAYGYLMRMKVQPDNKIVGFNFGVFNSSTLPFTVVRFNEDGTPDNSFGTNGIVTTDFGNGTTASATSFTLQDDGKIVVAGDYYYNMATKIALVRYNTDGTLDAAFGTGGKVTSSINAGDYDDLAADVKIQPSDNKIVITGISEANMGSYAKFFVGRFNANGTIDNEFGTSGYTMTDFTGSIITNNSGCFGENIFVLSDGKILAYGTASVPGTSQITNLLARYRSCSISVTNQPADQTVQAGTTASFTVGSTSPSATYQWQTMGNNGWEAISNGGQYSGVQTATLHIANVTAANDQQQFRSVAVSGVCTDTSDAATLTVTPGTGIDDIAAQTGVRLYPNPVSNLLTVEFHNPDYKVDQIRITDALGRVMETLKVSVNKTVTILSGSWPAGIYMVEVIPEKECPVTFRVIKQ